MHGYLVTSRLLAGHNLFIFNTTTHPIDFGRVVKLLDCKTSRSKFLRNAERLKLIKFCYLSRTFIKCTLYNVLELD